MCSSDRRFVACEIGLCRGAAPIVDVDGLQRARAPAGQFQQQSMRNASSSDGVEQRQQITRRRTVVITRASAEISLGMQLGVSEDAAKKMVVVVGIHPNSPASNAAIQPGWTLVEINGLNVHGYSLKTIVSLFKVASTRVRKVRPRLATLPTNRCSQIQVTFEYETTKRARDNETDEESKAEAKKTRVMVGTKSAVKTDQAAASEDKSGTIQNYFTKQGATNAQALEDHPKLADTNVKTVEALKRMYGFLKRDAIRAVVECGDDVQRCREYIEEKRFQEDMNKAQILSEQQRQVDEERETQVRARSIGCRLSITNNQTCSEVVKKS